MAGLAEVLIRFLGDSSGATKAAAETAASLQAVQDRSDTGAKSLDEYGAAQDNLAAKSENLTEKVDEHTQSLGRNVSASKDAEGAAEELKRGLDDVAEGHRGASEAAKEHTSVESDLSKAFADARASAENLRAKFADMQIDGRTLDTVLAGVTQKLFGQQATPVLQNALRDTGLAGSDLNVIASRLTATIGNDLAKGANDGGKALKDTEGAAKDTETVFTRLEPLTRTVGNVLTFLGAGGGASAHGLDGVTQSTDGVVGGFGTFIPVANNAGKALEYMQLASSLLIPALIALVVVFSPLIAAILSFTVALAGAIAVMAVGLGAPIGLAAAFTVLGATTDSTNAKVTELKNTWTGVFDSLKSGVIPIMSQVIDFLDQFAAPVQAMGEGVERWLGGVLPQVLQMLGPMIQDFLGFLRQLGQVFAGVTQYVLQNAGAFQGLWADALHVVAGAIQGMMTNLVHLSTWFFQNLPAFEPIIKATFGVLGDTIQITAKIIGGLGLAFANFFDGMSASKAATAPLQQALEALGVPADKARAAVHGLMVDVGLLGTILKGAVEIIVDFGKHFAATFLPSYHGLTDTLESVQQRLGPFLGILQQVGSEIGTIAGHIISADLFGLFEKMLPPMISVGTFLLNTLNPVLKLLADHSDVLYPIVVALGVAFAGWKTAEAAYGAFEKLNGIVNIGKDVISAYQLQQDALNVAMMEGLSTDEAKMAKDQMMNVVENESKEASLATKLAIEAQTVATNIAAGAKQAWAIVTGIVTGETEANTGAVIANNAAWYANPIVLIIAAIVAAIALLVVGFVELYKHSETFRNIINEIGTVLKDIFLGAINLVKDAIGYLIENWKAFAIIIGILVPPIGVIGLLVTELVKHWNDVIAVLKDVGNFIADTTGPVLNWLWQNILKPIGEFLGSVFGPAITAALVPLKLLGEGIKDAFGSLGNILSTIGGWINDIIKFFDHLYDVLVGSSIVHDIVNGIVKAFTDVWKDIAQPILNGINSIIHFFENLASGVKDTVKKGWDDVTKGVGDFFSGLGSDVQKGWQTAKTHWDDGVAKLKQGSQSFWQNEKQGWSTLFNDTHQLVQQGWQKVSQYWQQQTGVPLTPQNFWNREKQGWVNIFTDVRQDAQNFWNWMQNIWNNTTSWLYNTLIAPWWDRVRNVWRDAHTFIENLTTDFSTWLRNAWQSVTDWLYNTLIAPWWNRIKQVFQDAHQFLQNITTAFHQWLRDAWSNLTSWIENLLGGWWQRVKDGWNTFKTDISNLTSNLVDEVVGFFQSLPGRVASALSGFVGQITDVFKNAINAAASPINKFIDGINALLEKVKIGDLPKIPTLASGGEIPAFAAGGSVPAREVGGGFIAAQPTLIVRALVGEGEGAGAGPEYVIPTASAHRSNALRLWQEAGSKLGAFAAGGEIGEIMDVGLNAIQQLQAGGAVGTHGGQCVAEGTPVVTEYGPVAIEDVRPGDRVLTRHGYQTVLESALTRRKARVLRIEAGGQEIVVTPGHRLWAAPAPGRDRSARYFGLGPVAHDESLVTRDEQAAAAFARMVENVPADPELPVIGSPARRHLGAAAAGAVVRAIAKLRAQARSVTLPFTGSTVTAHRSSAAHLHPSGVLGRELMAVDAVGLVAGPDGDPLDELQNLAHLAATASTDGAWEQPFENLAHQWGLAQGPSPDGLHAMFARHLAAGDVAMTRQALESLQHVAVGGGEHKNAGGALIGGSRIPLGLEDASGPRPVGGGFAEATRQQMDPVRRSAAAGAEPGGQQNDDSGSDETTPNVAHIQRLRAWRSWLANLYLTGSDDAREAFDRVGVHHAEGDARCSDTPLAFKEPGSPGPVFDWHEAQFLRLGDHVWINGRSMPVQRIAPAERVDTYNLTVCNVHEFYTTNGFCHLQCVVYVENVEGIHFNVDYASQMASYVNSHDPKVGNVFVSGIPPYGHTGIVNGPNSVIDSNWNLDEVIRIHPLSDIPDMIGYIDLGKGLPAGVQTGSSPGGLAGIAMAAISGLTGPLNNAMKGLDTTYGVAGQFMQGLATSIESGVTSVFGTTPSGTSSSTTAVSGQLSDWIQQAIKLTGVDPSWAAALGTIAMHESGGNPSVDQGGLSGYAQAHGVMQMIQATFAANALPGHTDIYNPVDNIASAIEYIKQRYGNPNNTPGIRSINSGGSYQGYATGGIALTPQLAALAENGPEAVLPLTGARGGELSDQTDLLQEAVDILKQIAAPNPKVPSSFSARMRHA